MIEQRIRTVLDRVAGACRRAGRDPGEVTLVAVSKLIGADLVREASHAGLNDFGENYIQELRGKKEALSGREVRWHFVGHLQTNKVKYIAGWIHLIHAVDSIRLGEAISEAGRKSGRKIPVLAEVNTTGEATKFGLTPEEIPEFAGKLRSLPHVDLQGLMTMGPLSADPEDARPSFRTLRELAREIGTAGHPVRHLSMGMTGDFEVAIEEGATILRIGTAIFGPRTPGGH